MQNEHVSPIKYTVICTSGVIPNTEILLATHEECSNCGNVHLTGPIHTYDYTASTTARKSENYSEAIEDLKKARWYLNRYIAKLEGGDE